MDMAAVKAYLPKPLKRQAFAAFALSDTNFSRWTREHLELWLQEMGTPAASLEPQTRGAEVRAPISEAGSRQ